MLVSMKLMTIVLDLRGGESARKRSCSLIVDCNEQGWCFSLVVGRKEPLVSGDPNAYPYDSKQLDNGARRSLLPVSSLLLCESETESMRGRVCDRSLSFWHRHGGRGFVGLRHVFRTKTSLCRVICFIKGDDVTQHETFSSQLPADRVTTTRSSARP